MIGPKTSTKSLSKDDLMDRNPGSPYIDVEALSDEDSTQSQKLCTDQAEDQRVLTLAEQFLAAMPARIKNDQGEKNFLYLLKVTKSRKQFLEL